LVAALFWDSHFAQDEFEQEAKNTQATNKHRYLLYVIDIDKPLSANI